MREFPTLEMIKKRRQEAGLYQRQAASLVNVHERTWRHWEGGTWQMPASLWELFLIKTQNACEALEAYFNKDEKGSN